MSCCSVLRSTLFLTLVLLTSRAGGVEGYVLGAGIEADSADGIALSTIGEFGISKNTWLSAALARNMADLPFREDLDTWYGDIGIDHWWDPVGVRAGVAYWGDNDTLDSTDYRASLYWRVKKFSVGADYEFRDFSIQLPATDRFPGRKAGFEASGVGLTSRLDVTDSFSVALSGMDYDYDVNLRLDRNQPLLQLLSFSRFSLINSLVDYRAYATFGLDAGARRWQLDIGTWKGEVDGGETQSVTLRYLNPLGDKADIEFSLGIDDSELYGNVTFFSVFVLFYGGI